MLFFPDLVGRVNLQLLHVLPIRGITSLTLRPWFVSNSLPSTVMALIQPLSWRIKSICWGRALIPFGGGWKEIVGLQPDLERFKWVFMYQYIVGVFALCEHSCQKTAPFLSYVRAFIASHLCPRPFSPSLGQFWKVSNWRQDGIAIAPVSTQISTVRYWKWYCFYPCR
jgi:hypothetical protein